MASDRLSSHVSQRRVLTSPLRHYTGVWCLVVAALPVVVTSFGLIPVYESQTRLLPAYASFFCLLALAFVFSQRHRLARAMFSARLLWADLNPAQSKASTRVSMGGGLAAMIVGALCCAAVYLWAFETGRTSPTFPRLPPSSLNSVLLALSYITLFVLASAAFAVVAVREHLQHVLGLSDAEVITGLPRAAEPTTSVSAPQPAARHSGISVVADRGTRVSVGGNDEMAEADELFRTESSPTTRTVASDPGRF